MLPVQPAPAPHLYEIFTGDGIAYADEKGEYLLMGSLLETRSKRNLTTFVASGKRIGGTIQRTPLERLLD